MKKYWLLKTEPTCYSIDDLKRDGKTPWSGVRNYQARNFMRDEMNSGDLALIYHSGCKVPAVVGLARISSRSYPDATQFDTNDDHYDQRATKDKPVWENVDVSFVGKFAQPTPLAALKHNPRLVGMAVMQKGSRLSIQPVSEKHFKEVLRMAGEK